MTSTCISFSNARYSAAVSAIRGVEIRSTAGSFARLTNRTVLSMAPVSLKDSTKKLDSSNVIPIAANTTAKFSSLPRTFACLAIWAASCECGRPEQEKIGSFCPRTRVFSPSMADTPVWMNSEGYTRAAGFIGRPLISLLSSGRISGPSSIGRPSPSKTRPSISPDTPSSMLRPRKRTLLLLKLMPAAFS